MCKATMTKKKPGEELAKEDTHGQVRKMLSRGYAGYVLVTCKEEVKGKMQVEMTYDGDPFLASYMLEGAQGVLDEKELDPTEEFRS